MTELVVQQHILQCLVSLFQCLRHDNSLAGSQAIILQHNRKFTGIDISQRLAVIGERAVRRRRDIVLGHQRLGEILAGLDAGRSLRRAENFQAAGLELIHDAGSERNLGTDHGKVNAFLTGEISEFVNLGILQGNAFRLTGNACVTWSTIYFFHA